MDKSCSVLSFIFSISSKVLVRISVWRPRQRWKITGMDFTRLTNPLNHRAYSQILCIKVPQVGGAISNGYLSGGSGREYVPIWAISGAMPG
jgi:hypothetical protein